jgi:ClpP class serine protease
MSRVFQALTAEPWAIDPSWLPLLAALAQRDYRAAEVEAAQGWQKLDYDLIAGPTAQRIAGAQRAWMQDGVAVLPVLGPIFPRANMMTDMSGATTVSMLSNDLRVAMDNPDVGAIMLLVDSPGGQVSGIAGFVDQLTAAATKKPICAHVAGAAASAAYWIASAAGEIAIERTGMAGSIGVVAAVAKQVEPDAAGVIAIEIVSSNAPNKRPDVQSEAGADQIRATLDAIEAQFIGDVAAGRKTTTAKIISNFGGGNVMVGSDAVKAGMADKMQSQDTTMNGMRRMVANQKRMAALTK